MADGSMVTSIEDRPVRHPASLPSMSGKRTGAATVAIAAGGSAGEGVAADLATFVADHYDRLIRLAWLVCRDGADAGDAVQAGLEVAWRRRETLRDKSSLRSWL